MLLFDAGQATKMEQPKDNHRPCTSNFTTQVLLLYQVFLLYTGNDRILHNYQGPYITEVLPLCQVFLLCNIQVMTGPYNTEALLLCQVFLLHTGNDRNLQYRGPPIFSSVPLTYK